MAFLCIESANARFMEAPFSKEEVFCAFVYLLSSLEGDETLGLHGFTLAFW